MKEAPWNEALWQPTRDFDGADRTLTAPLGDYIVKHNLLAHLH